MTFEELQQNQTQLEEESNKRSFLANLAELSVGEIKGFFNGLGQKIDGLKKDVQKVQVTNPVNEVSVKNFPKGTDYRDDLKNLLDGLSVLYTAIRESKVEIPEVKIPDSVTVKNLKDIPQPKFEVKETKIDLSSVEKALKSLLDEAKKTRETKITMPTIAPRFEMKNDELLKAINELKSSLNIVIPETTIDLNPIMEATQATTRAIKDLRFPVPNTASSWQHSLTMQSEDQETVIAWKTVNSKTVPDYKEFTGVDGNTYRKTFSYDVNGNSVGWTGWERQ